MYLDDLILTACMPQVKNAREWAPALEIAAASFEINTPLRMAMFLAQIGHESEDLTHLEENLNYSAKRLAEVWPKRFAVRNEAGGVIKGKPNDLANEIAGQPQRIANIVYANRMGNGGEESGEGWNYRGRGPIQLTGKGAYAAAGDVLQIDLIKAPDRVLVPRTGALCAALFFKANGCLIPSDKGELDTVTGIINGGTTGIANRAKRYARAMDVLGAKL